MAHQTTLAALIALAVTSSAAFAQNDVAFSKDGLLAFAPRLHGFPQRTPNFIRKTKSETIFSNLATAYPNGLYFSGEGYYVGVSGGVGSQQFLAGGFTPAADATAVEVDAGVSSLEDGQNSYTLGIYSDNAGVPGQPLATAKVKSKSMLGSCCALVVAKFPNGVALTGGTPYWVALTLNQKQIAASDEGVWNLATTDQVDLQPFAYYSRTEGWTAEPNTTPPAFGVFSK